jgi:hypothetical protein
LKNHIGKLGLTLLILKLEPSLEIMTTLVPFHVQQKLHYFSKCQNLRKLKSLPTEFLKKYCLLKPKFVIMP